MTKDQKPKQSPINIRPETLERFQSNLASYIGKTGKAINRSEYLDRISQIPPEKLHKLI